MKNLFHSMAAFTLAAIFALSLTGCGHHSNSFTWQVEEVPNNLDPQLAVSSANRIAVTHLYSGLFRLGPDGEITPECVADYTVSEDGLTYTFTLKEGLVYQGSRGRETEYTVTAQDFVFGLQRVFMPQTNSPYAAELGNIRGSAVLLNGGNPEQLGVHALDDLTLEIQLTSPDEDFTRKLCLPGAMPCDKEFFNSTGGAYGLSREATISNGSFYLYSWTGNGLFLRRDPSGSLVDNLRLVIPSTDDEPAESGSDSEPPATPAQRVIDGKCDAALANSSITAETESLTQIPYASTTWALIYNCEDTPLSSAALRSALTQIAWNTPLTPPAGFTPATGLLPPAMGLGETSLPTLGDPNALFQRGLQEAGIPNLTGLTVMVPTGTGQLFGTLNQEWQKQLQAFFSVKELPLSTLTDWVTGRLPHSDITRLEHQFGEWAIALIPMNPTSQDPLSLLYQFNDDLGGWQNFTFRSGLDEMARMPSGKARQQKALQLEQLLLHQGPVAPLFFQSQSLLVNPEVENLVFDPFGPLLDLTYATKG